jgi:peptidoglycan/LPS O-acetylase OafA/YrhL
MTEAKTRQRVHIDFLDGIRGLACLYVAMYHAAIFAGHYGLARASHGEEYSALGNAIKFLTSFGHYGVAVFIVLSGFCLAIPVARDAGLNLRGGIGEYLKRRARRILPTYYAAPIPPWEWRRDGR